MIKHEARKVINNEIWNKLEAALHKAKHSQAGTPGEIKGWNFLEAMLYLLRAGSPWRDLPAELGYWHAVYMRFRRWEARGVWMRLWKNLQGEGFSQARRLFMDSTTVRAHQHAAGTQKNGSDQALGRSRGGMSTKVHAATIDENCSVALHLTSGQAHDGRQFESLYESLDSDNILESAPLDKGYDADRIRERLSYDGIEPVISPISTRSKKLPYDKTLYRDRNCIERFFNKIKQFHRIATRYDKLAKTFFASVYLVAAFLIIKNS